MWEKLKQEATAIAKDFRMQVSYTDCASMPIPLYESCKDLIARQDAMIDELVSKTNIDVSVPSSSKYFPYLDTVESGVLNTQEQTSNSLDAQKGGDLRGKLLPCPFCGGEAELNVDTDNDLYRYENVSCPNAHCCGTQIFVTPEEWNTRAPSKQFTAIQQSLDEANGELAAQEISYKQWVAKHDEMYAENRNLQQALDETKNSLSHMMEVAKIRREQLNVAVIGFEAINNGLNKGVLSWLPIKNTIKATLNAINRKEMPGASVTILEDKVTSLQQSLDSAAEALEVVLYSGCLDGVVPIGIRGKIEAALSAIRKE